MRKIPSLFIRNFETNGLARNEVTIGCEWVVDGEGLATIKLDGTACLIQDGALWKRYDAKTGRVPPKGFLPAQEAPDPVTGHFPGWLKVGPGPEDRWHREALEEVRVVTPEILEADGTYELLGPKVQGNPYGRNHHTLIRHGSMRFLPTEPPRDYAGLQAFLKTCCHEGIVWHHPDGRMAKLKRVDFGFPWPNPKGTP